MFFTTAPIITTGTGEYSFSGCDLSKYGVTLINSIILYERNINDKFY
ncbi:MAG: hypothetical protein WC879_16590 [Melioribacteraceae bacterium]